MLSGCIVSLITPFSQDLSIDEGAWDHFIDWQLSRSESSFLIGSDLGEGTFLQKEELLFLLNKGVKKAPYRKWIVELQPSFLFSDLGLVSCLKKAGAAAAVLSLEKMEKCGLGLKEIAFFSKERFPLILEAGDPGQVEPLSVYLSLPYVSFVKDVSSSHLLSSQLIKKTGAKILLGSDLSLLHHLKKGEVGGFSCLASAAPKQMEQWVGFYIEKNFEKTSLMQKKAFSLIKIMNSPDSVYFIKRWLSKKGLCQPFMRDVEFTRDLSCQLSFEKQLDLLCEL